MKLTINDVNQKFKIDILTITSKECVIASEDLVAYISDLIQAAPPEEIETAPPPPTSPKIIYKPAENLKYDIEAYKSQGWTHQELIDAGHLVPMKIVESGPPGSDVAPAPPKKLAPTSIELSDSDEPGEYIVRGVVYVMAAKAGKSTHQKYLNSGWDDADLIDAEYLVPRDAPEEDAPEPTWPTKNENEEWVDSAGTVFNKEAHGMSKDKVPAVTVKGVFKKRKGYKPPKEAPAQSQAELDVAPPPPKKAPKPPGTIAASKAPLAPTAAQAASASGEDEPLDAELESMIKNWA